VYHTTAKVSAVRKSLLLLGTATAGALGSLDGLLVALGGTAHGAHEAGRLLEGALEVATGRLAEDVDLDHVVFDSALEGKDGLDEERVGVLHVKVHEAHHGHAHGLGAERSLDLLRVVGVDSGGDELGLLSRADGRRLDVLEGGEVCQRAELLACENGCMPIRQEGNRTLLLVDEHLCVEVEASDDEVAQEVHGANTVEDVGVVKGDTLGDLHHSKNDDNIDAGCIGQLVSVALGAIVRAHPLQCL